MSIPLHIPVFSGIKGVDTEGIIFNLSLMSDYKNEINSTQMSQARSFGDGFSLEVAPANVEKFDPDASLFPSGSLVFLPHLPGQIISELGAACRLIVARGYSPVAHIGARHLKSKTDFRDTIRAILDNGARDILLLAGDRQAARGPFSSTTDLISSAHFHAAEFNSVMISGYPEGHPRIPPSELKTAMLQKLALLQETGCNITIVSQFAFAADSYIDWVKALRDDGITVEIRLGVAGVTSLPMLLKYARLCGVGASISMLKTRSRAMLNMLGGYTPGALIKEMEEGIQEHGLGDVRLHFFPFGGADKTLDWIGTTELIDART